MKHLTDVISFRFFLASLSIAFLSTQPLATAYAQGSSIVQPIGHLVQEWTADNVNAYLEKWDPNIVHNVSDPFDNRFPVSEITPTQPMYFVRVYNEPNSGPLGSFIMRAASVRGLTPAQLRDVFALPEAPTKIVYVKVPAGAQYGLWTGIAGPIMTPPDHVWGNGGAEQIKIIGTHTDQTNPPPDLPRFADYTRLPSDSYMNAKLIGDVALSYHQTVNAGNAGHVAAYLDKFIPKAYSDLEDIYTVLDFVNFATNSPDPLASVLEQISPVTYDAFSTVYFRNDLLFENMILEHYQHVHKTPCNSDTNITCINPIIRPWINLAGIQGEQSQGTERPGFDYRTGALMGGVDWQAMKEWLVGISVAYLHNQVSWATAGGSASIDNAKLGIYANYQVENFFFDTTVTGGYSWSNARRNIKFTGTGIAVLSQLPVDMLTVDRTATSSQNGGGFGLYLTGGLYEPITNQWQLVPQAQISYFLSRQGCFYEHGANSLDLIVESFTAQTVRTQLALALDKTYTNKKGFEEGNAHLLVGWAHNFPLDNRVITSGFQAVGGEFNVTGYHEETNSVIAVAGVSTKMTKNLWVDGNYNADLSHGFNEQALSLTVRYLLDV